MGGRGGGSGSANISTSTLPAWAIPYAITNADSYLKLMETYSGSPYEAYGEGSTVGKKTYAEQGEAFTWVDQNGTQYVDANTYEIDGIKAIAAAGREASGMRRTLLSKGETLLQAVVDGLKFNLNTKIDDAYLKRAEIIVKEFEETTLPRLAQQMNLSGNYGSYGHHYLMAKAAEDVMAKLAETGMDLYFKDYVLEKSFQMDAVSMAPSYSEQEIINADLQIKAGELQREFYQGKLMDDWKKWAEKQQGIIRKLEVQGNSIRTLMGAQAREVVPYYRPSDISQVAGIGLAALGIYGAIKGGNKQSPEKTVDGPSSTTGPNRRL